MKKHLLFLFTALLPFVASAEKVEIDGIWYDLTSWDKQAEVTNNYGSKYSGSITLPATVTYDGVEYRVTSIGDDAFSDCESLTAITIPESVESIGSGAFRFCTSLTAITIPEGVTRIVSGIFCGCNSLTAIVVAERNGVYDSRNGCNAIIETGSNTLIQGCAATIIPEGVTSIGYEAFNCCFRLTAINIPEGVTSIEENAFLNCYHLTDINIPESVTSIGRDAFNSIAWYDNQPDGVLYLDKWVLGYKGEVPSTLVINDGTKGVAGGAFSRCSVLTSIILPEGVMSIGGEAFYNCTNLTDINIPESVTSIGAGAFNSTAWYDNQPNGVLYLDKWVLGYKGEMPSTLVINDGTKGVASGAFSMCSDLAAITIPESVTSIGGGAFYDCSSLTSITIPKDVTSIGEGAFYRCRSLTAITIPEGVTSIGERVFCECESLTSITLPEGLTRIGDYTFAWCRSLIDINIPESVTSIGYATFFDCWNLTTITIPENSQLTSIGSYAFSWCSLTAISCKAMTPPTIKDSYTFEGVDKSIPVYVPANSVDAYKSAAYWGEFINIMGITDEESDIENSEAIIQNSQLIYDVNGRRITDAGDLKGIYIVGRCKVILK